MTENTSNQYPLEFLAAGWNAGIKDATLDFGVLFSKRPCVSAAIFTRNNFPGNPVIVGREHSARGAIRAVVVNSKNANVATGPQGLQLARDFCRWTAESLSIREDEVLPSSTGVIGRPIDPEKIKAACEAIPQKLVSADFPGFARAIMTTDQFMKMRSVQMKSGARLTAVAKGAGMIQPDMATMLSYVATDARLEKADLDRLLKCTANRTLNRLSVDGDTSTSDTFAVLANGASNVKISFPQNAADAYETIADPFIPGALSSLPAMSTAEIEFLLEFQNAARDLTKMIASDGEGATKLIELQVVDARDRSQALKIARSIINSPLVKTAVYGGDPNWGRLIMAIGKVFDEPVNPEKLKIFFGDLPLGKAGEENLQALSNYLKNKEILIRVSLGEGKAAETLWGCDVTEEYIRINSFYTT